MWISRASNFSNLPAFTTILAVLFSRCYYKLQELEVLYDGYLRIAAIPATLIDLYGYSPITGILKCNFCKLAALRLCTLLFGRPFVKRFALCHRTVVLSVMSVCLRRWCIVAKRLNAWG